MGALDSGRLSIRDLFCRETQHSRDQKAYVVIPEIPIYGLVIAVRQSPETDCVKDTAEELLQVRGRVPPIDEFKGTSYA